MKRTYEVMHGDRVTAQVDTQGYCRIFDSAFLPYDLYLEETKDGIDILVNNVTNFYYWCATRVLTLDRQYAKEILNSIGAAQAVTDRDRAMIALAYRCLTLTDIFWVREAGEKVTFAEINLYNNHLDNAFVDVSLRGRQMTVENHALARDLSTNGCFPKAWVRTEHGFVLLKDGGVQAVADEILASRICRCFDCCQVIYEQDIYDGEMVSSSDLMTSPEISIASMAAFQIYAVNRSLDLHDEILKLDACHFYMMNILDYLVGNTDRHWGNWGLLIDNHTNRPVSLHPLMDFNQAFHAYDTIEGANCQTVLPEKMTQLEAAVAAVRAVGLNQLSEVQEAWFDGRKEDYEMFLRRLELLRQVQKERLV